MRAILDCTNGWYAEQTWAGTRLDRLLPPSTDGSVLITSVTGYRRRLPADPAEFGITRIAAMRASLSGACDALLCAADELAAAHYAATNT